MDWHMLGQGRYSGRTLPEVMFQERDPNYVFDGLENGEFDGPLRAEALELRRRLAHAPVSQDGQAPDDFVVFYRLKPDGSYGGMAIVPRSCPKLADYEQGSAAHTDGCFDLTVLRRIAPKDKQGTLQLMLAFDHHCLNERMTLGQFFGASSFPPPSA